MLWTGRNQRQLFVAGASTREANHFARKAHKMHFLHSVASRHLMSHTLISHFKLSSSDIGKYTTLSQDARSDNCLRRRNQMSHILATHRQQCSTVPVLTQLSRVCFATVRVMASGTSPRHPILFLPTGEEGIALCDNTTTHLPPSDMNAAYRQNLLRVASYG